MRSFYLLAAFCLALFSNTAVSQNEFITEWEVTTAPYSIRFPGIGSGYKIVWEKTTNAAVTGTINNAVSGQTVSLPESGTYLLKVTAGNGVLLGLNSKTYSDSRQALKYVRQWGTTQWQSLKEAFYNCWYVDVTATDAPKLATVTDLSYMFYGCGNLIGNNSFNSWNTSAATNMSYMFARGSISSTSKFNASIGNWDTEKVTDMSFMFEQANSFNQPIGSWNTSNVTTMKNMFYSARVFNQPIGSWNTAKVTTFESMFTSAKNFNQEIGNWNTSSAKNMMSMFSYATNFNHAIGNWNTANVTDMALMFSNAINFNQPIGNWNTANVTNMYGMFNNASSFNQAIGNWSTNNVQLMNMMLQDAASFNQSLATWNLSGISSSANLPNMLSGSGMDCSNYSTTLVGWANSPNTPSFITLDATGLFYNSTAQAAHNYLVNTKGWTINGDFYFADCGVMPVTFGTITATLKNKELLVTWSTLQEINNDHFEIEASEDGKNFKAVATIKTQAKEGNSDTQLNYEWSTGLNSMATVLGFPALIAFFIAGFYKRRKSQSTAFIVLIVCSLAFSCSKMDIQPDPDRSNNLYIRIKQVDKDGTYEYSKTVKVIQK